MNKRVSIVLTLGLISLLLIAVLPNAVADPQGCQSIGLVGGGDYVNAPGNIRTLAGLLNADADLSDKGYTFTAVGDDYRLGPGGNNWIYNDIQNFDAVIVSENGTQSSLSAGEMAALEQFYDSGKPILLFIDDVDDEPNAWGFMEDFFGITGAHDGNFYPGSINGDHPITAGLTIADIQDLVGDPENDYFLLADAPGVAWVIRGNDGQSYVVAYDRAVRTVTFGDDLDHRAHNSGGTWWVHNPQLVRNAIDWLCNQSPMADPDGPYLGAAGSPITFDGSFSFDPDNGPLPLNYYWEFGDGNVDDTNNPTSSNTYVGAGIYEVCLTVDDGDRFDTACTFSVIYDPSAGFVTGGGWIDSSVGAYVADPTLMGRANFGFVSKYKKGATVPTGQTEFQFQAGNLNFHSSSYEWLVVTGSNNAKFKGLGTINGSGDYKFMLWAGDGEPDTFRIKIWYEDESNGLETVVYDNGIYDSSDDQPIAGGNIKIHTGN